MRGQYATLKDVAERANTTAATVSYVLNGSKNRYVSEDMRRRVEEAAKELNYVKSSAASSLKGKQRKIIAVLVPQFANQFFTEVVLAIERVADQHGYILSICNTFDDPQHELEVIRRMQAQRVDGFIITPSAQGHKNTRTIRKTGIPMVVVDRTINVKEDYFLVSVRNYESTCMTVEYLLNHGHRNIAYVGWTADFGGLELRKKAYQDTLIRYGVSADRHVMMDGAFTAQAGYELTRRVLTEHPEVTAIFYAYNVQAKGGVDYLSEHGIQIGKDISVIILGAPDWAHTGNNNFTCVDINGTELGLKAAEMLFDIIKHEDEDPIQPYHQSVNVILKEGNSVCSLE